MSSHTDNYWPEPCATCQGTGNYPLNSELMAQAITLGKSRLQNRLPDCFACGGKAFVLVLQPARQCFHCGGTGKMLATRCLRCNGTGWMYVQKEARVSR